MPGPYTAPGVYIEEVPSGVRTITGVATSIAAFVGRALRGPVDAAVVVNGFADFEQRFGGLSNDCPMSFAVRDFFRNGGGQAVVVRAFNPIFATWTAERRVEAAGAAANVQTAAETAASPAGATAAAVGTAAAAAATAEPAGSPRRAAADFVAAAATAAATVAGATPVAVRDAVRQAAALVQRPRAQIRFLTTAEQNEALAAATAVANAATGADAIAAAAAAQAVVAAPANANEPRRSAAQAVLGAATAASAAAGATAAQVQAAARGAVVAAASRSAAPAGPRLVLEAAAPGTWANALRARIDHDVRPGADQADLFNLTVSDGATGTIEVFRNVAVRNDHPRRVDRVLAQESVLVRVADRPTARPSPTLDEPPGRPDDESARAVREADFGSDGLVIDAPSLRGSEADKTGMYRLADADLFNLLCIPPLDPATDVPGDLWSDAVTFCERRRAMAIIDPPASWRTKDAAVDRADTDIVASRNAAIFFPRVRQANPLREGRSEEFPACGAVAGVFARTDATRGVWKAPAGLDARLVGVDGFAVALTDGEVGELNPLGVNCLRAMPAVGAVVWGSRTREGADRLASEWKYIPVRRTALMIEESLWRGTQWVVFEPNDEPLWAQIRLNIGAFMNGLFRQGAFAGATPRDAYFVKCDRETTTQQDVNLGIVNILVGFAPLKPAEFVVIRIQQMAGQIAT